jgi:hypothetical protein
MVAGFLASLARLFSWLFGGAAETPEPAEFIVEAPPTIGLGEIAAIFHERLGGDWQVRRLFRHFDPARDLPEMGRFFFASRPQPIDGNPFDASYSLMKGTGLMSATPNQTFTPPRRNPFRDSDAPAPDDKQWHLKQMKVPEAWQHRNVKGAGVRIGHLDTGWTVHDDLDSARLRTDLGFDFLRDQQEADDPLPSGSASVLERDNPGHGTKSGSVIMSGESAGKITGVAPEADLVPIRCVRSVVIVEDSAVAEAVDHAVKQGCDVISMSIGGFPSPALHAAVRNAVASNVIVVAAAGNEVTLVVFPAGWPECLAIGGSAVSGDTDWDGTSWGPPVDICAPAERVWCAVHGGDSPGTEVAAHSGTTFATANVAGVAALWVATHGRDELLRKYRGRNFLQEVFRHVISVTAHVPDGWDHIGFGAGIIRADRVVREPLPVLLPNPVTVIKTIVEWFLSLFAEAERAFARIQLVTMFAGPNATLTDAELESLMQQYGVELLHLLMSDADAFNRFRESVAAQAAGAAQEAQERLDEAGAALQQGASNTLNQVMSWAP